MTNMIGIGPFITIPLLLSALGGPQAMLGWLVALVITISDGMIWSELGAAMPGSGGSYIYLREGFGRETFGRLMGFLFIWQFILSGPLEIASGYIGFTQYLGYIWKDMGRPQSLAVIVALGVLNITLLYRRITFIGKLTVSLWIGTILTTLAVIVTGALQFQSRIWLLTFRPAPSIFHSVSFLGLGAATRIGIFDYLGYYDICYIGDEVRESWSHDSALGDHQRDRSCADLHRHQLFSDWSGAVARVCSGRRTSAVEFHRFDFHGTDLRWRRRNASLRRWCLWTAFGSVFALLLGYSRVPYAAAHRWLFLQGFRTAPSEERIFLTFHWWCSV